MEGVENLAMLHWVYVGILFIFGLAMGSFLNVVAYRVPMGVSIISPPSACPSCGKHIAVYDNVPLLGWLMLGGKCRNCRTPISIRYPLVELATGILWALVGWRLANLRLGYYQDVVIGLLELAFVSAMVVTFLVDLDFRIILDEISLGGLVVALAASVFLPVLHHADSVVGFAQRHRILAGLVGEYPAWVRGLSASLVGAAVGLALSLAVYFLGNLAFRKQIEAARQEDPDVDSALGIGDVKLMAFFGAFLGWQSVLVSFAGGSLIGSVVGTAARLASGDPGGKKGLAGLGNRWNTGDSVFPFGPFLVTGALLYFFLGDDILRLAAYILLREEM